MTVADQLAQIIAQQARIVVEQERTVANQDMLVTGTADDPASFNSEGGKTGQLGYYPVVDASGITRYMPCTARLMVSNGSDLIDELFELLDRTVNLADFAELQETVFALSKPTIASLFATPALIEIGSGEPVALAWTVSRAPASQTLDGAPIGVGVRSGSLAGPWPADRSSTLMIDDGRGNGDARTVTVRARVPIFAGLAASSSPTAAEIRGAQYKALDSDHIARSFALDRTSGGHPFVVVPAALSITSIMLGGFAVGGWTMSAPFNLTLATGVTASMRVVVLGALTASSNAIGVTLA